MNFRNNKGTQSILNIKSKIIINIWQFLCNSKLEMWNFNPQHTVLWSNVQDMCYRLTKVSVTMIVIHYFSGYSMIRHYGFYQKHMIRHFVIHPTKWVIKFLLNLSLKQMSHLSLFENVQCYAIGKKSMSPARLFWFKSNTLKTRIIICPFYSHSLGIVQY